MNKTYIVDMTEEEQLYLLNIIRTGNHSSRKINRARILLLYWFRRNWKKASNELV